jgi:hypothetical protein
MATDLRVIGPINIDCQKAGKRKNIGEDHVKSFFKKEGFRSISKKQGCYVFALKAGLGYTPWYVGKTTRSMIKECMTDKNLNRYNNVLFRGIGGTPVMFFIVSSEDKNKIRAKVIDEVETFLIECARSQNKHLKNKKKGTPPNWNIKGVIRSPQGAPKNEAKAFKKMMGL